MADFDIANTSPLQKRAERLREKAAISAELDAWKRSSPPPAPQDESFHIPPEVDLKALGASIERKPLDEIAALMRALTYGEMIELAEGFWKAKPEDKDLNEGTLPGTLHRWATKPQEDVAP